jgi:hypothetical protein
MSTSSLGSIEEVKTPSNRKLEAQANEMMELKSVDHAAELKTKHAISKWLWIFVALTLVFVVGTIVIVVLSLEQTNTSIPAKIDVVIYERPTVASRMSRHIFQSRAVYQYMPWTNHIYVLSATQDGFDDVLNVTFVPFNGTLSEAFEYMPSIPNIMSHAIFLSDMTLPFRNVQKSYFFANGAPRIFNIFREQSEVDFFTDYLELPTMPTLVTDLEKLREAGNWQDLVFREVTEERVVLRGDMNRDIFIISSMPDNTQDQFSKLVEIRPLFITFHVSPKDTDPDTSNNLIADFLSNQFPNAKS